MRTLAYVEDDPSWNRDVWLIFSDLTGMNEASFVPVQEGDLVLALSAVGPRPFRQEWLLVRVFRVAGAEETGDALCFDLRLERVLSDATSKHAVSRQELLDVHGWLPEPAGFFRPFPRSVWIWLREVKHVPLPLE